MYIVKENGDGTVTIDREVYNELHRKASAYNEIVNKTSDIILKNIENFMGELNE